MSNIFTYAVLPLISVFVGSFLAFYFSRKNSQLPTNSKITDLEKENAVLQERVGLMSKNIEEKNVLVNDLQNSNLELQKQLVIFEKKDSEADNQIKNFLEQIAEFKKTQNQQTSENLQLNNKIHNLEKANGELSFENKNLKENLQIFKSEIFKNQEQINQNSLIQFQNLANKILEEKSQKFSEVNFNNISTILQPLGKNIEDFKKQINEVYDKESKERFSLEKAVKLLQENSDKVSEQANNLAKALQGNNKKLGNWGEMILEAILQHAGLIRNVNYFSEKSFVNEEGKNLRPDFQILLPDDRLIITDSKVSLTAYEKYCNCNDQSQQKIFIEQHLKSIYNHIETLGQKKYHDLLKSLDFTIMFIPVESAYLLAMQADEQLWIYAYERKILLVSPTNLIVCLKLISDLWQREIQTRNALKIVESAEKFYDKLINFSESFVKIGNQIESLGKVYEQSVNQFSKGRGNLISKAQNFKNLGLKSHKKIPEILIDEIELDNNDLVVLDDSSLPQVNLNINQQEITNNNN